jgi:hypothetical protein
MSPDGIDEAAVRNLLRAACANAGGFKNWGMPRGINPGQISDTLSENRGVSERVANALGLTRRYRFYSTRRWP